MRWAGAKSRTRYFQANPSQPMPSQQTRVSPAPPPTSDQKMRVRSAPSAKPSSGSGCGGSGLVLGGPIPWQSSASRGGALGFEGLASGAVHPDYPLRMAHQTLQHRPPHEHEHEHEHRAGEAPPSPQGGAPLREGERRKLALALCVAIGAMVAEGLGGWLSNSLALLSAAGHLLADVAP